MTSSTENEQASGLRSEARQNRLIVVLADISGYADLMVRNQTAAMHGQIMVTMRIEAMLKQVEIPLRLQEMEGDADFSAFSLCIWDLRSYVQGHSGHGALQLQRPEMSGHSFRLWRAVASRCKCRYSPDANPSLAADWTSPGSVDA